MKRTYTVGALEIIVAVVMAVIVGLALGYLIGKNSLNAGGGAGTEMPAVVDQGTGNNQSSDGITVGGSKLLASQNLLDNSAAAPNLTNAVAAVRSTGLADIVTANGPYTFFVPTNDAFGAVPGGIEELLKPENKARLAATINNHLVPGAYTSAELISIAAKNEKLTTTAGSTLTLSLENNSLRITNAAGAVAIIESADAVSSNGIIHTVTAVLAP